MTVNQLLYNQASFVPTSLPSNVASSPANYQFRRFPFFQAHFPEATPLALTLFAQSEYTVEYAGVTQVQASYFNGDPWIASGSQRAPSHFYVGLELSLGTQGITQTINADWKVGTYRIPPCERVSVNAIAWRANTSAPTSQEQRLQASLIRAGSDFTGSRLTSTSRFFLNGGGATQQLHIHEYARWANFWPAEQSAIGGANSAILTFEPYLSTSNLQPSIERDYADSTWFPVNYEFELERDFFTWGRIRNDGASNNVITFRQYLEL